MTTQTNYRAIGLGWAGRPAPAGFTPDQWKEFDEVGFIAIPDALSAVEVLEYRAAAQECLATFPDYDPAHTWKILGAVRKHPRFTGLIDHERHVGFAYDLYGDQLALSQADLFVRPRDSKVTRWHIDGPLTLPYRVFSPRLPLKLRIVYWLTDVEEENMGNLVYVPGSHREAYTKEHSGLEDVSGQRVFRCKAGTMSIMNVNLWHRVMQNLSDSVRLNVFVSYVPSWCTRYYRYPKEWIETLNREQQIILRHYDDEKLFSRPPVEDLPLFLSEHETLGTQCEKEPHKIRRYTRYETNLAETGGAR